MGRPYRKIHGIRKIYEITEIHGIWSAISVNGAGGHGTAMSLGVGERSDGLIPVQAAGLIFGDAGFKEILLFAQVDGFAHPWEGIGGAVLGRDADAL